MHRRLNHLPAFSLFFKTTIAIGPVNLAPSVGTTGKQTTLVLSGTF